MSNIYKYNNNNNKVCQKYLSIWIFSRVGAGMIIGETALTWRGESQAGRSRTEPRRLRRRDCQLNFQAIQTSKARALRQWRGEPAQKRHTMVHVLRRTPVYNRSQSRVNKNSHQENSLGLAQCWHFSVQRHCRQKGKWHSRHHLILFKGIHYAHPYHVKEHSKFYTDQHKE